LSTALTPSQVLELIAAVFSGSPIATKEPVYQFSNEFIPETIADEEIYLQVKKFEFDLKFDFIFNLTRVMTDLVGAVTMKDRDGFVENYYNQFKNIVANPQSRIRVIKSGESIVSLILGTYLPMTLSQTSYNAWGIPKEAPTYIELDLANQPQTYECAREKDDSGLIVISKQYMRAGPLELCSDSYNLLINTRNQNMFTADNTTQATRKLLDIVLMCQAEIIPVAQLFGRVDQPCEKSGRYVSSGQKNSYLVLVDLATFTTGIDGYVKVPVTNAEDSFGRTIAPLRYDSKAELLYKDVSLVDKAKLTKSDRYAIVAECGPLFVIEKTSKHREIRKKTENTKTFRADLCNSLLYQFCNLILGDELEAVNLKPHHKYLPIIKEAHGGFVGQGWDHIVPTPIKLAGDSAIKSWWLGQLDAAHVISEPLFKTTVALQAETYFKTNNRTDFFTSSCNYLPQQMTQRGIPNSYYDIHRHTTHLLSLYDNKLLSFNDRATVSMQFKQILSIYDLPEDNRSSRCSRNQWSQGTIHLDRAEQLHMFYLDNFIPQKETEDKLMAIKDTSLGKSWRSSLPELNLRDVPESDILIEEALSLSMESVQFVKSMATITTYSGLKTWWTFAKQHLETVTVPSLLTKYAHLGITYTTLLELNIKSFLRYTDWMLDALEVAETKYLGGVSDQ
jgi:hypothetical protein